MTTEPPNLATERPYDTNRSDYLDRVAATFVDYKRRSIEFCKLATGERILDVGCGTGQDAVMMAGYVGPSGRVTGIDREASLIAEAQAADDTVDFLVGDVMTLPFDDGLYDCTRADRVFQHLTDPVAALAEMVRVTAVGGRIVVIDVDWDTFVIDASNTELTRRIIRFANDCQACGWAGRQLYGLFHGASLAEVEAYGDSIVVTDLQVTLQLLGLSYFLAEACRARAVTEEEAAAWMAELEQRDTAGRFFAGISGYCVRGQRTD